MLDSFRNLPEKDMHEKKLVEARSFFWRVVYVWLVVALILAFVAMSLLISHTAYVSAHAYNASERKVAEIMWSSYCSRPVYDVPLHQVEHELKRPLNCTWARLIKDMDLEHQSTIDSNIIFNFSRLQLTRPWAVISIIATLFVLSLVMPFLAAWYYFRETRRKIELQQKAFSSTLTIAQRASLHRILTKQS